MADNIASDLDALVRKEMDGIYTRRLTETLHKDTSPVAHVYTTLGLRILILLSPPKQVKRFLNGIYNLILTDGVKVVNGVVTVTHQMYQGGGKDYHRLYCSSKASYGMLKKNLRRLLCYGLYQYEFDINSAQISIMLMKAKSNNLEEMLPEYWRCLERAITVEGRAELAEHYQTTKKQAKTLLLAIINGLGSSTATGDSDDVRDLKRLLNEYPDHEFITAGRTFGSRSSTDWTKIELEAVRKCDRIINKRMKRSGLTAFGTNYVYDALVLVVSEPIDDGTLSDICREVNDATKLRWKHKELTYIDKNNEVIEKLADHHNWTKTFPMISHDEFIPVRQKLVPKELVTFKLAGTSWQAITFDNLRHLMSCSSAVNLYRCLTSAKFFFVNLEKNIMKFIYDRAGYLIRSQSSLEDFNALVSGVCRRYGYYKSLHGTTRYFIFESLKHKTYLEPYKQRHDNSIFDNISGLVGDAEDSILLAEADDSERLISWSLSNGPKPIDRLPLLVPDTKYVWDANFRNWEGNDAKWECLSLDDQQYYLRWMDAQFERIFLDGIAAAEDSDSLISFRNYRKLISNSLVGTKRGQHIGHLYGATNRGKTYLLRVLSLVFPKLVVPADISLVAATTDIMTGSFLSLNPRARIAYVDDKAGVLSVKKVKALTGGDKVETRTPYVGTEFQETKVTMLIVSNDKPEYDGKDPALLRRICECRVSTDPLADTRRFICPMMIDESHECRFHGKVASADEAVAHLPFLGRLFIEWGSVNISESSDVMKQYEVLENSNIGSSYKVVTEQYIWDADMPQSVIKMTRRYIVTKSNQDLDDHEVSKVMKLAVVSILNLLKVMGYSIIDVNGGLPAKEVDGKQRVRCNYLPFNSKLILMSDEYKNSYHDLFKSALCVYSIPKALVNRLLVPSVFVSTISDITGNSQFKVCSRTGMMRGFVKWLPKAESATERAREWNDIDERATTAGGREPLTDGHISKILPEVYGQRVPSVSSHLDRKLASVLFSLKNLEFRSPYLITLRAAYFDSKLKRFKVKDSTNRLGEKLPIDIIDWKRSEYEAITSAMIIGLEYCTEDGDSSGDNERNLFRPLAGRLVFHGGTPERLAGITLEKGFRILSPDTNRHRTSILGDADKSLPLKRMEPGDTDGCNEKRIS